MLRKLIIMAAFFVFALASEGFSKVKSAEEQRLDWDNWLETLKAEMIDKGISKKTIKNAYKDDYFHEVKDVVLQDLKQPEFILTSDVYINRLINEKKLKKRANIIKSLKQNMKNCVKITACR